MGTVKDFVAYIFIGTCLLATLAACEASKHAEIMSMEDLRAQSPISTAADTETEKEEADIPFEGKPTPSAGLSEPLVFTPEPPPSPAPAPKPKPKPAPPAPEPKPAPPAPEPKPAPPAPEPKPAPPAPEPKPAPPPQEPVVGEIVPVEEPVPEPKIEIAKLEPDDFVPEEPQPDERPAPEPKPDSGLADVFFDFDQYVIRPDAFPILEKDAEILKSTYKDSDVLIEGHCDERGTLEYNLELGKRRAQAVKDYLVDLGIEESRIRIVSYGKERPFCTESNESCFQKNRRGHFVRQ